MVSVAIEVLVVREFTHLAKEADELLLVNSFDAGSAGRVSDALGDEAKVEQESHAIFEVLIFAGD